MDNGGWLDEVVWLTNTDDKDDLEYLEEIIASNPKRYKKLSVPGETLSIYTLYKAWELLERGRYYVKIDDDIVRAGFPFLCCSPRTRGPVPCGHSKA